MPHKLIYFRILLLLLVILGYSNSLNNEFQYEDIPQIVENEFIKDLRNIPFILDKRYYVLAQEASVFRPFVTITYFLDYYLYRLDVRGWHLTNLLLHGINSVLCFEVYVHLLQNIPISFLAAAIFAVHPLQTESVNLISFRENLLYFTFYFLSFLLFIKFRESQKFKLYIFSLICYLFSIFSKELAVTLPLLLFLYDILFKKTSIRNLFHYIGYLSIISLYIYIRFFLIQPTGFVQDTFLGTTRYKSVLQLHFPKNLILLSKILFLYIYQSVFPFVLTIEHKIEIFPHDIIFLVLLSLFILVLFFLLTKYRLRLLSFFIASFFLNLLPVAGFIPLWTFYAERFMYFSIFGFAGTIGWIANKIYVSHRNRNLCIVLLSFLVLCFLVRTFVRNFDWRNQKTLWESVLKYNPTSQRAYFNIGLFYERANLYQEALTYYQKALCFDPTNPIVLNNIGMIYVKLQDYEKASQFFYKSIQSNPTYLKAYNNLGIILTELGQYTKAIECFQYVIKMSPLYYKAYNNLGYVYERLGNITKAAFYYKKSLEILPTYSFAIKNLERINKEGRKEK
jgi:Tfp pilus assembly protein PilF